LIVLLVATHIEHDALKIVAQKNYLLGLIELGDNFGGMRRIIKVTTKSKAKTTFSSRQGFNRVELVIALMLFILVVLVAAPVGYFYYTKAHRQSDTIKNWGN